MAGDSSRPKLEEEETPSPMEAAKKPQQPPTPKISRADDFRSRRIPLSDLTNDLTPSKGRPPRAAAGEGDASGTGFISPLGLDSIPSCRVTSSYGIGIRPVICDRSDSGPTWKCKGKEVASSSAISPNRMSNNDIRVDCTSEVASSKQAILLPFLDDSRVEAIEEDAPGMSFDLLGLNSTPSHDFLISSSGRDFKFRGTSRWKEMTSSSGSSQIRRSSRIRKRLGEVEDRAVSKSCIIPSRKVRNMSSSEVGARAISESCSLPNKRKQLHPPPGDMEEASKSLQEFIRQQKSYFAEVDSFELPEEEASDNDSE